MSGINQRVQYSITQIRTTFADDLGNRKSGSGTGFFLLYHHHYVVFITNRHNVDGSLKLGEKFKMVKAEILLRRFTAFDMAPTKDTKWFELNIPECNIVMSRSGDVAAISKPIYLEPTEDYRSLAMMIKIADQADIERDVQIMDATSFIGFPGAGRNGWWDQAWHTPVARLATIASDPEVAFSHSELETGNAALVAGFSFSGSSGSPLFLHAKGIGIELPKFMVGGPEKSLQCDAMLIGIMSGHCKEDGEPSPMFNHSGLSYYTRSSSILELLRTIEHKAIASP